MVKKPSAWAKPVADETSPDDYVIQVLNSPTAVDAAEWNTLLMSQSAPTPFMRHEYLSAMHHSSCADASTGWSPHFFLLRCAGELVGATMLYLKSHSLGEYVFDWSWANAYAQHGLAYYPKALCAVPFTPVPGSRLIARNAADRAHLAHALVQWCGTQKRSSLHCLFVSDEDVTAMRHAGMLARHTVQFHWENSTDGYASFDSFLGSLAQEKRKKIRQERRKVTDAGVSFRTLQGCEISACDWDFFYRCYERTYFEHGNVPYLNRDFFHAMANTMPEDWLLFVAERNGQPIASSLIAINASMTGAEGSKNDAPIRIAYGRYWGALERVDCLHFEACYYQPLAWCIANGYQRFEGGAQGEHKLARALLPVTTTSMHWLAHPQFFDAVDDFLARERDGIADYMSDLQTHSPFKQS
jgi:predicted N-acyltransferase